MLYFGYSFEKEKNRLTSLLVYAVLLPNVVDIQMGLYIGKDSLIWFDKDIDIC
jgi:hypothetical protein